MFCFHGLCVLIFKNDINFVFNILSVNLLTFYFLQICHSSGFAVLGFALKLSEMHRHVP